ncbi:MAG TPA: response regulator [Candidatus Omnitrophota bacterium]|nr:response regulator [Candidatus Omnitrophota bacterium]HRZ15534.1 response regulator [Candidatus Omnitrophota bacterium]
MKVKILAVDDEPEVLEFLQKRLEKYGYAVVTAGDGVEGILSSRKENPDLILLDIMMPNKDGMTMLRELQADESTRRIPVIMVTAKGETNSVLEGQSFGATDYIIKPFDFDDLLRYIRRYAPDVIT